MVMKIGELAQRTGLAASRIRFYESIGLLKLVQRQANGYRSYPEEAVLVLNLIQKGRLNEMSFAFNYRDAGTITVDGEDFFEVRSVELYEVSVVPIGANRETEILSAKSARELLTAVKQANLDAATEAVVVDALTRAAGETDNREASPPPTPPADGENITRDALALHARARLALMERMGN